MSNFGGKYRGVRVAVLGASGFIGSHLLPALGARRGPATEIVVLEKGHYTAYSACGIPYVVGGDVKSVGELVDGVGCADTC